MKYKWVLKGRLESSKISKKLANNDICAKNSRKRNEEVKVSKTKVKVNLKKVSISSELGNSDNNNIPKLTRLRKISVSSEAKEKNKINKVGIEINHRIISEKGTGRKFSIKKKKKHIRKSKLKK